MGLQQVSSLVQRFGDCRKPEDIVRCATDGLVEAFDCAFARIWLMEPDGQFLRLVASSGLYTRLDGSFARVPLGAFKVGKIAQNRIPFLSNNLSNEAWVKDRDWAIANQITGFAGYPLAIGDRVIGVLAVFSH
ncbi:MAG: GAF domain-containing protein, partial [Cyanobacteriota bacterium]